MLKDCSEIPPENAYAALIDSVQHAIAQKQKNLNRVIIGIAGPPAAGKSTLAALLVAELNKRRPGTAALAPMDGFHLDNTLLKRQGLLHRKGAPETFDFGGFQSFLMRLRESQETLYCPMFDRDRDMAIAGALAIPIDVPVIVVEGNYLLLETPPWKNLQQYFDHSIFCHAPLAELERRLIARWINHGYDTKTARQRAEANDMVNVRLVLEQSRTASQTYAYPDFQSAEFLQRHITETLDFYRHHAFDPAGGFYHCLLDDGTVYDTGLRHLVSSCRFVFNFALAFVHNGNQEDKARAAHGLAYLKNTHRQSNGSYAWQIENGAVTDATVMGYGHAFVLLAAACAIKAGISEGQHTLEHVWRLLETYFWEAEHEAYCDEYTAHFATKTPYRGQNVNMHMCEACIAAWQATGKRCFLARAQTLARKFAHTLAAQTNGLVWEHYHTDWTPDYHYNQDKPDDLFRPWGYQPGHQAEWARLLLMLDDIAPEPWYLGRAEALFQHGLEHGKDQKFGGIFYGFAPDGTPCSTAKYYWVHSETIASAWRLYQRTGNTEYLHAYQELWRYAWRYFVDHRHGAWYRVLTREGNRIDDQKSPPGKTDYHTLGVCWDLLEQSGIHPIAYSE